MAPTAIKQRIFVTTAPPAPFILTNQRPYWIVSTGSYLVTESGDKILF